MKKKLSSFILLMLFSLLIFALPTLADSKPAASNSMSNMDMSNKSASTPEHDAVPPSNITVAKESPFQVSVQSTPEKPAPNQPVNLMITVKNKLRHVKINNKSVYFFSHI